MKDFREELNLELESGIMRVFEGIVIGEYMLSIQASDFHYCSPRETLTDIYLYESWEVGIFKNKEWMNIELDSEKEIFSKWEYYNEFVENYDGMVSGYINTETVQSLYEFIKINKF